MAPKKKTKSVQESHAGWIFIEDKNFILLAAWFFGIFNKTPKLPNGFASTIFRRMIEKLCIFSRIKAAFPRIFSNSLHFRSLREQIDRICDSKWEVLLNGWNVKLTCDSSVHSTAYNCNADKWWWRFCAKSSSPFGFRKMWNRNGTQQAHNSIWRERVRV